MTSICLGPKGTFSEEALRLAWRSFSLPGRFDGKLHYARSNEDVMPLLKACEGETVAVLAIHNLAEGRITGSFDDLAALDPEQGINVIGAIEIPVSFALLARSKAGEIKGIVAHKKAIRPCKKFLAALGVPIKTVGSNARAAKLMAAGSRYKGFAALAPIRCAKIYGLYVWKKRCEDAPARTMFCLLAKGVATPRRISGAWRALLAVDLDNRSGALHRALGSLARRKINMTYLHPAYAKAGRYRFLFEIEGGMRELKVLPFAIKEMRKTGRVSSFGPFPLVRL